MKMITILMLKVISYDDIGYETHDPRYSYSLMKIFLHQQGDNVYRILKELEAFDFNTDEGIDFFFSTMEEICEKIVDDFDVDAYLNDNLHIMEYYMDESYIKAINIHKPQIISFEQQVKFYFNFAKRPSMQYLLKYLEPANLNLAQIHTEVIPPSYQRVNRLNELEIKFRENLASDGDEFKYLGDIDIFRSNTQPITDIRQVPDIFEAKKYKKFYKSLLEVFIV